MIPIPSPRSRRKARIEIIPLIDIIFFLFATFVMVSLSMVKNKGIPVNLPAAATGAPQSHEESAVVTVDAAGALFFNRQSVTAEELGRSIAEFHAAHPDATVFINGDARAEFGGAVAVLDQLRALGISKIAIETRPAAP